MGNDKNGDILDCLLDDCGDIMPVSQKSLTQQTIGEIREHVEFLLAEVTVDTLKEMNASELLEFVERVSNLDGWKREEVQKGFKWTSEFGTFVGGQLLEDGKPDLTNFTLLIKGKGNIVRLRGRDSKYTCLSK